MKKKTFEIDMTPSWGFVAELILAMLDCNTNINSKTRHNVKMQLEDMSRVADAHVKLIKEQK
jgi:hypothetical protein|tara:strand:- start:275 stop:460 length:186 start_codon:yes stop_codon:yes gene_type:complete